MNFSANTLHSNNPHRSDHDMESEKFWKKSPHPNQKFEQKHVENFEINGVVVEVQNNNVIVLAES